MNSARRPFVLLVALAVPLPAALLGSDELLLVASGRSSFRMITLAEATAPVAFASQELQKCLAQIFAATLPIRAQAANRAIFIGVPDRVTGGLMEGRAKASFVVRSTTRDLSLFGNTPLGTLYAVYFFLEKYVGCGRLHPADDAVPRRARVSVPVFVQDVEEPKFLYRNLNLYPFIRERNVRNADWPAKNGLNWVHACTNSSNLWNDLDRRRTLVRELKKRGLHSNYGGQTFNTGVPPRQYFAIHPECFNSINGKRDPAELCVWNRHAPHVAAEYISKFLYQKQNFWR